MFNIQPITNFNHILTSHSKETHILIEGLWLHFKQYFNFRFNYIFRNFPLAQTHYNVSPTGNQCLWLRTVYLRDFRFCYAYFPIYWFRNKMKNRLQEMIATLHNGARFSFLTAAVSIRGLFTFPQDLPEKKVFHNLKLKEKLGCCSLLFRLSRCKFAYFMPWLLYFATHQQHNNSKESKKNIIIFISFKINPITFLLALPTPPRRKAKTPSTFFTGFAFVLDLILI